MTPPVPPAADAAEVRSTACNRDCPDACVILATVESQDGVERVTSLRGDPDDPVTKGFLCERTSRFLGRQYAADRFTSPMVRRAKGGPLEPIGWDEALDLAARRLRTIRDESGPEAILHYVSGGSLGILKAAASLLFERFGPVTIKRGDICSGAGEAAQEQDFGVSESHDLFDLAHSATIVLWGKNPHVTGVHLLPVLRQAREAGAVLVGIDPIRTRAAELCDLFLQPRPGADAAVAFGMARWAFDHDANDAKAPDYCENHAAYRALVEGHTVEQWAAQADVPSADLERAAELYATRGAANIQVGWGLGRRGNGSATVRALDALGAVTGNLGVPGGGVSYYFGRRTAFDLDFIGGVDVAPRSFPESRLGPEWLGADPPVRAAWITAGNPVAMLPESDTVAAAVEGTEFVVVVDTHPTDTTDRADLVLPTLTLLEDDDVLGAYGHHLLRESRAVVAPPAGPSGAAPSAAGGPRHELTILQGLAERLGVGAELAGSVDDWKRRVTATLDGAGAGLEAMRAGPVRNPFAVTCLFADRSFPTPSGKACLIDVLPADPAATDAEYPLLLLATSTSKAQSSQWSVAPSGLPEVTVHPESSAGADPGGRARLQSRVGALEVVVRHDAGVRRDVALMAKGGMLRDGRCANQLVRARETDAGGGACFYDEAVRLAPL